MLSAKLIQLIEDHWQGIMTGIIHQMRSDPRLHHISGLPETELRDIGRGILRNLGHWLTASRTEQHAVEEQYEGLGRVRFAEHIPLAECVCALQVVKSRVVEFTRDHEFSQSSVEVLATEELEHQLNEFFDDLVYHEVIGYEGAMRKAMAAGVR
ncbi:MAG: hypothetical protein JSU00_02950 [Acidobacteria bacterium]|nr:hypothetical protein [Acidobacteriota bacterium]